MQVSAHQNELLAEAVLASNQELLHQTEEALKNIHQASLVPVYLYMIPISDDSF